MSRHQLLRKHRQNGKQGSYGSLHYFNKVQSKLEDEGGNRQITKSQNLPFHLIVSIDAQIPSTHLSKKYDADVPHYADMSMTILFTLVILKPSKPIATEEKTYPDTFCQFIACHNIPVPVPMLRKTIVISKMFI